MMQFEEIYDSYKKAIYNLALNYLQNAEDAEEITQDTFVTVFKNINSFQEKSQLSTWIYRIAINKSIDFIRSKKRQKRFAKFTELFKSNNEEVEHLSSNFDHPGVLLEQKENIARIFNAINDLPENQKTALILSKLENKSQKEVAEIMNLSPKAVESLIQRAKVNLLKKIDQAKDV